MRCAKKQIQAASESKSNSYPRAQLGLQYWFNSPHAVPHAVQLCSATLHSRLSCANPLRSAKMLCKTFPATHTRLCMKECVCVCTWLCVCVCLCVPTSISIIWSALQLRLQFSRSAYGGHFMAFHWFGWPTKGGRGQGEGKGHNCLGAGYGFRFFVCVFVDLATKQRKMYKNRWLFCGPQRNRLRKNIDAVGEHWLDPKPKSEGTRSQYTPAVAIASKGEKEWERSGTKTAESKHAGACFTAVFVWSFMWPIYGLHVVVCV